MPATFDKLGLRFFYPDNWELDESEVLDGNNTVSVDAGRRFLVDHHSSARPRA